MEEIMVLDALQADLQGFLNEEINMSKILDVVCAMRRLEDIKEHVEE
jgi:hypothetical protein